MVVRLDARALLRAPAPHDVVQEATTPGRVRLTVPGLLWNEGLARTLTEELEAHPGIRDVSPRSTTGRILVRFDPRRTSAERIATHVRAIAPPHLAPARSVPGAGPGEDVPWHALSGDEVLARVRATAHGLDAAEARARLEQIGANRVVDVASRSALSILADQLASRPALFLLGAAGVSILIGDLLEAAALGLAVGANVSIGFVTERRAEELIRGFRTPGPRRARVRRSGRDLSIDVSQVVPGDVLLLASGDVIPADARLLRAHNLQVDESSLTGESIAATKDTERRPERAPLAERGCLVYRGTAVVTGEGEAVVVATGGATEVGRIARLLREAEPPQTPLEKELDHLSRRIELVGLGATIVNSIVGIARGRALGQVLRSAIALGVAAIPEGLPATATTALALGMRRLRTRGIVIRRLAAAETLGAATVICCDKTGTLTQNLMCVEETWTPAGEGRLLDVLALSHDVRVLASGELEGSSTEKALFEHARARGVDVTRLLRERPKVDERPRRPGVARVVTVHRTPEGLVALAKGSPDAIREILGDASLGPELERRNVELAARGRRVLAAASRRLPPSHDESDLARGYQLAGLVALHDPLRRDARETIERARRAGIRCVVLTGDQLETARAVAWECGLHEGEVVEAHELEQLDERRAQRLAVVARATPEDKLRVVRTLQRAGEIVAMAGDGVNDSVALRAANVGVAITGRGPSLPVALADVVLATEGLSGILEAVAEGRTLRDNIGRAANYLVATNASEILLVLSASLLGLEDPLTPLQLLWINLVGDTAPAIALALEPGEPDVLVRPPHRPGQMLIPRTARRRLALEAALLASGGLLAYAGSLLRGAGHARARTTAGAAIMVGQLLHAFNYRARRDELPSTNLVGAMGAGLVLEGASLLVAPVRALAGSVSLSPLDFLTAAAGALAPQAALALLGVMDKESSS